MIGIEFLTSLGALPAKAFSFSLRSKSKAATVRRGGRSHSIEGASVIVAGQNAFGGVIEGKQKMLKSGVFLSKTGGSLKAQMIDYAC